LVGIGQNAAAGTNAGATNTGSAISTLLGQQGNASAAGSLGAANSMQNAFNSLGGIAGRYFTPTNYYGGGGGVPDFTLDTGAVANAVNALPGLPSGGLKW
jgi:hypothetical protein